MKNQTMGVLATWLCFAGAAQAQVNVQGFLSGDNQMDAFTGTASGTTTHLGGLNDWNHVLSFNTVVSTNGYLYVAVSDYGDVVALGGYISTNGGTTYDPILPGMGWESYNAGPNSFMHPDQAGIDSFIAAANAGSSGGGNGWVAATAGTASIAFGLPNDYNGMTPLGCIWDPRAGVHDTVVFRLQIVPTPHSAALLLAGVLAAARRRRS